VCSAAVERLGDGKQTVRDEAQRVLQAAMAVAIPDLTVAFAPLAAGLEHRNWRVREQALFCFAGAVESYGPVAAAVQEHLAAAIKLLEDSNANVRKACTAFLEQCYARMGARLLRRVEKAGVRQALISALQDQLQGVPLAADDQMFPGAAEELPPRRVQAPSAPAALERAQPKTPGPRPKTPSGGGGQRVTTPPAPIVRITTEKQMAREVEDIATMLSSLENPWDQRVAALRRLQGMVRGDVASMPGFLALLATRLKEPVGAQCLDLRSLVVKEAGKCIEILSTELGDALEPLTDHFVDALFKLAATSNKTMAECGHQAMLTMLQQSRVNRGVNRVLEVLATNKNAALKQRAAEYLAAILRQGRRYTTGVLERLADNIEAAIRSGISDGAPGVRSATRIAFWPFALLWPDRGARFLDSLEPGLRRLVKEDEAKALAFSTSTTTDSSASRKPLSRTTSSSSSSSSSSELSSLTAVKRVDSSKSETMYSSAAEVRKMFPSGATKSSTISGRITAAAAPAASAPERQSRSAHVRSMSAITATKPSTKPLPAQSAFDEFDIVVAQPKPKPSDSSGRQLKPTLVGSAATATTTAAAAPPATGSLSSFRFVS
jgi:CLIP-associating protein 1/2